MVNASGVCRGDRNRNARAARLRGLVAVENAIVGIGLADKKQVVVNLPQNRGGMHYEE
jgi:transposase